MFGERCSRQDPEVDECLLRSFNSLVDYLKGGAPELGIEEVRLMPQSVHYLLQIAKQNLPRNFYNQSCFNSLLFLFIFKLNVNKM